MSEKKDDPYSYIYERASIKKMLENAPKLLKELNALDTTEYSPSVLNSLNIFRCMLQELGDKND